MVDQVNPDPLSDELESLSPTLNRTSNPFDQPWHLEPHLNHGEGFVYAPGRVLSGTDGVAYASSNNSTDESRSAPTVRADVAADTGSRPPTPAPIDTQSHIRPSLGQSFRYDAAQPLTQANIEALNNATWSPLSVWVETHSLPDHRLPRARVPLSTKVKKGTVDSFLSETDASWVEVASPQSDRTAEDVVYTGAVFEEPSSSTEGQQ